MIHVAAHFDAPGPSYGHFGRLARPAGPKVAEQKTTFSARNRKIPKQSGKCYGSMDCLQEAEEAMLQIYGQAPAVRGRQCY